MPTPSLRGVPWPDALPDQIRDRLEAVLAGLPEHRQVTFALRVARWWPDLLEALGASPDADADDPDAHAHRLLDLAATTYRDRDPELHLLDERRGLEPDWFRRPGTVGYAAYVDRVAPEGTDLEGVGRRAAHLHELGVSYLHLLPPGDCGPDNRGYVVPARPGEGSGQAAAALHRLARALRQEGISLGLDLVPTSDDLDELAATVLSLANHGAEVLRLDELTARWGGSDSMDESRTHTVRVLRILTRIATPSTVFSGRAEGLAPDLLHHDDLMVQIWSMLACRDARLATHALSRVPERAGTSSFSTYLRSPDDIVWKIDDADARSSMVEGWSHREFLSDFYSGKFEGSFAEGVPSPAVGGRGRPVSGTAAGLVGLGRGERLVERARDAEDLEEAQEEVDRAVARLLLGYTIVYGHGGLPIIWSGDEIATLNECTSTSNGSTAWVNRPRLDPERMRQARAEPGSGPGRVLHGLRHLAEVRAGLPQLDATVPPEVVAATDPGVFAVLRRHPAGLMLALYNVTESSRTVPEWWVREQGIPLDRSVDALNGYPPNRTPDGSLYLSSYQPVWLVRR